MIHHSFNSMARVSDRQSNNDSTYGFYIIMYHTGRWNCVLRELNSQHICYVMTIDILPKSLSCLFHWQNRPLFYYLPISHISSFLQYPQGKVQVLIMRTVVFQLLFILIVLNVRNIRVNEERILSEVALEKQLLLFL